MLFTVSGRVSVLNDASSCMSLWDVFYHILWMWEKTVENATILNTLAGGFLRLMSLWWFANYKSCEPAICLCHKTFSVPSHINVVIVKVSSGIVIRKDKETICVEIKDRFVQSFLLKCMLCVGRYLLCCCVQFMKQIGQGTSFYEVLVVWDDHGTIFKSGTANVPIIIIWQHEW